MLLDLWLLRQPALVEQEDRKKHFSEKKIQPSKHYTYKQFCFNI